MGEGKGPHYTPEHLYSSHLCTMQPYILQASNKKTVYKLCSSESTKVFINLEVAFT